MNKNPRQLTFNRRRCAGGRSAQRGSAILLVLVAMVLMAILAGSLLQLTRFERIPRSESNIEVVIASVIDEILIQATEDLTDDTGLFLNPAGTAGGYDEPYDYPWTNDAISGDRTTDFLNGNPVPGILGGRYDDTWLASHMPTYSGPTDNNGTWRKITSLTGLYLGGDNAGSADLSLNASPIELFAVSNLANPLTSDTNINLNTHADILVDADGDGIGDSRWEWAPLRQVGATQYVMAVRIVDLSARMDLNVALGSTPSPNSGAAITLSTQDPFGDGPTELDGAAFVALMANQGGSGVTLTNAREDWRKTIQYRLTANQGATGTLPVLNYDGDNATPTAGSRREYWTKGASRTSNTFGRNEDAVMGAGLDYSSDATFGLTDAFELLQGNGLNSNNATAVEDLMANFLRRDDGQEDGYAFGSGTNQPNGWNARQFWELDPRKHVSMYTGVSIAAKPLTTNQPRALKLDVNKAIADNNLTALRNRIDQVFSINNATLLTLFPHLDTADKLSDQLAVNLYDYVDLDNTVTVFNGHTGFEALPYITEVYTQRLYEATVTPNAMTSSDDVSWAAQGQQGYAIEIGNPFGRLVGGTWQGREVLLTGVFLQIGTTQVELSALPGLPAGKTTLGPGEVLIIKRNSDDGTGLNDLTALYQASNKTLVEADVTGTAGYDLTPGAQTIELFATVAATPGAAGATATWAYAACEIAVPADPIAELNLPTGTIQNGYQGYARTNYQGVGDSLQMMTVNPDPSGNNGFAEQITSLGAPSLNCDNTTGAATLTTDPPALQNPNKPNAPNGFTELAADGQQIVWQDNPRERLHWVGDILQIPLIRSNDPGAPGSTTADSLYFAANNSTSLSTALTGSGMQALMLPYKANASLSVGAGTLNYPHSLLLIEQLTTFNPATDGEDGDGQGHTETFADPDDNEVLVPGKLNINTAPYDTLVRLLPFPELATREAIASQIILQRQQTKNWGPVAPAVPGIPYTTALYETIENLPTGTPAGYTRTSLDSADTTNLNGVRIDLNNHETTSGTYSGTGIDGIADDREEEIMLTKWLTEMTDTRSDVFAAYIVVQGYQVDGFSEGATESARLIVIFSRAGVDGTGGKAVEIGRFRIN